jgi:predicted ester cyclase
MSEENKAVSRRLLEQLFNEGNLDVAEELIAPDAIDHDPQNPFPDEHGPEVMKKQVSLYRGAFPDLRLTIEEQIAEGDLVATRWSAVGTHEGELMGVQPTHKQATVTGIALDRIEGGKIVEAWGNWDTLGMMQQLGLVPEEQPAT